MSLQIFEEHPQEIQEEMRKQAPNTSSCLDWHKFCGAECCKVFRFPDYGVNFDSKYILMRADLSLDMQWYVKLRGCTYTRGILKVPTEHCVRSEDGNIYYKRACDLLQDDLKCAGHPDKKPKICSGLTKETAREAQKMGSFLTPNCLFTIQIQEEDRYNGKTEE